MTEVIIVGSGPAGMTAAVYACRSGKSVMVVEKEKFGGQITSSPKVENFPGRLEMAGPDFANDLLNQAMENGAEFTMGNVVKVEDSDLQFATVIYDAIIYWQDYFFGRMLENSWQNAENEMQPRNTGKAYNSKNAKIYDLIPEEFTIDDIVKYFDNQKAVYNAINRWLQRAQIICIDNKPPKRYKKVV